MKGSVVAGLMMIGALGSGAAAAYFANRYIDSTVDGRRAELTAQYAPVRVVVASADLRPGTLLSGQTVAIRELPRAFLHSEAVLADNWNSAAGRVLAHAVRSGEPVLDSHLAHDVGAGFSSQLAHGKRALTFPVDDEASISGMLAPGDRIDLFFTTMNGNESVTLPLLLNIPVIATGIRTMHERGLSRRQTPIRAVQHHHCVRHAGECGENHAGPGRWKNQRSRCVSPRTMRRSRLRALPRTACSTVIALPIRPMRRTRVEIILGGM